MFALIKPLYPEIEQATSVLETALSNLNAVFHPPGMIMNAGWIQHTGGDFLFYREGITDAVGRVTAAVDAERMAVAKALGIPAMPFLDVFYEAGLTTKAARDSGDIARACQESEPNKTIKSPPSLDHRYVHEDVGYGLVPMAALGPARRRRDADHRRAGAARGPCGRHRLCARRPDARTPRARRQVAGRVAAIRRAKASEGSRWNTRFCASCERPCARPGTTRWSRFSQDNVTYTAGFLVPSHASNRFRRTITVIAGETFAAQIVVNVEENLARQRSRFADIRAYNQFTQDPADMLADALIEAGRRAPGASRSSSITCRRRTTSGCASGCPARHSCRAAISISTPA